MKKKISLGVIALACSLANAILLYFAYQSSDSLSSDDRVRLANVS